MEPQRFTTFSAIVVEFFIRQSTSFGDVQRVPTFILFRYCTVKVDEWDL